MLKLLILSESVKNGTRSMKTCISCMSHSSGMCVPGQWRQQLIAKL